jgi:hypothetical protein
MAGNENCAACRFWKHPSGTPPRVVDDGAGNLGLIRGDYDPGRCRRFPPRVIATYEQDDDGDTMDWLEPTTVWPKTRSTDYCGEFKPRDDEPIVLDGGPPCPT